MTPPARTAKDIFLEALDLGPPDRRAAFLDTACAGDEALRRRVEALLAAHERPESLLDRDPPGARPTLPHEAAAPAPAEVGPGAVVGPYTLLRPIGEGGMGTVYLAEQAEPVRRRVALKVIRPGLDSAAVLARFEAERQALALMDHPSIARVLDAGTTPAGRPYFVMELVEGVPITRYCDDRRLTPRERLELFLPVCRAVQHAHQKGIIHRDLKPSNVLVAQVDGRPVPKVIDFGIAKATGPAADGRTLLTQLGAIVGTPEYMSPEQATSGQDVDTRSDVYSLGVLLYELLTSTTPLDREGLRRAALEEVLRRVREEEPPRPSTRLSGTGERLPSVAAVRGVEPARLKRLVRGDLDWVVMKALDKERSRRYETASALADDVRRHLDGDPVLAGPPSRVYRLRKFARKYRSALATAGAFALLLVAATAVSTREAARANRAEALARRRFDEVRKAQAATQVAFGKSEEARAEAQRARVRAEAVSRFLVDAFRRPDPGIDGREVKVVDLLKQAVAELDGEFGGAPEVKGEILEALGMTYIGLGLPSEAIEILTGAGAALESTLGPDHPDTLGVRKGLANAYQLAGRLPEAIRLGEETSARLTAALGPDHPDTLIGRSHLGNAYLIAGRTTEAIALHEETLRRRAATLGPDHPDTLVSRLALAAAYQAAGRVPEAIRAIEEALGRMDEVHGSDHPDTLAGRANLASVLYAARRLPEATRLWEETLARMTASLGPDHLQTLAIQNQLGAAYGDSGRTTEAIALLEGTLHRMDRSLGPDHPQTLAARNNLATAYKAAGRLEEGIRLHEETVARMEVGRGPDHPDTLIARNNLARGYEAAGRVPEATRLHEENFRRATAVHGADHPSTLVIRNNLAEVYRAGGRTTEAIALHEETLRRRAATLGPDHPDTLLSLDNVATAYLSLDRWDRAEPLLRQVLDRRRETIPPDSPALAAALARLGMSLLGAAKWPEAEPVLRECLAIREARLPDDWSRFSVMSQLGGALLEQGRFEEAEPLVIGGYEGLASRAASIPPPARVRLPEAAERVVRLYEAWGRPEEADAWRARLGMPVRELPADVFARP